jgi:hypothetical protein
MSFQSYVAGFFFLLIPVLLVVFLIKGVPALDGSQLSRKAQPLSFWAYTLTHLGFMGLMAWLLTRDDRLSRDLVVLGLLVSNLWFTWRDRHARPSRLSKYEFAAVPPSRRRISIPILILAGATVTMLVIIASDLLSGRYSTGP